MKRTTGLLLEDDKEESLPDDVNAVRVGFSLEICFCRRGRRKRHGL